MTRVAVVLAFALLATSDLSAQRGAPPAIEVDIVVRPLRPSGGEVSSIEVRSDIRGALQPISRLLCERQSRTPVWAASPTAWIVWLYATRAAW
jgi:hypothetical protein